MTLTRREFVQHTAAIGATLGAGAYVTGIDLGAPPRTRSVGVGDTPPGALADLPLRPPGALAEDDFVSTCIRCLRCVDACPNQALVPSPEHAAGKSGGTPTLHPRKAACMLCASDPGDTLKCTAACPSGALQLVRKDREEIGRLVAIGTAELDLNLCYSYNNWSCGACYRACPLAGAAMTVGRWERPTVHAEACVGCGCCERACIRYPHAIRVRKASA